MGFARKDGLVARAIAGETIIVPVSGNVGDLDSVFTLDEVGTAIWGRLDGRAGAEEIAAAVAAEYDVEPGRARLDVEEFLGELAGLGIVEERREG